MFINRMRLEFNFSTNNYFNIMIIESLTYNLLFLAIPYDNR